MRTYCGLDVSNKSIAICVVDGEGKRLEERTIPTDPEQITKALKKWKNLKCVVEWSPLAESIALTMEEAGHEVDVLDVRQARVITKSKKKTDRLDAQKLAQLCRTGWYVRVHRKSGKARTLRSYLTARMQIVKAADAIQSSIRGIFRAHGIILPSGQGEEYKKVLREHLKKGAYP